jgi:hypothetical protein
MHLYYVIILYFYTSHVLGVEAKAVYEDTIRLVKAFYESKGISLLTAYVCWGECKYVSRIFNSDPLVQD